MCAGVRALTHGVASGFTGVGRRSIIALGLFILLSVLISTDNCARTISRSKPVKLARSFKEAAQHLTQAGWHGSYASRSDDVPMIASLFSCESPKLGGATTSSQINL